MSISLYMALNLNVSIENHLDPYVDLQRPLNPEIPNISGFCGG